MQLSDRRPGRVSAPASGERSSSECCWRADQGEWIRRNAGATDLGVYWAWRRRVASYDGVRRGAGSGGGLRQKTLARGAGDGVEPHGQLGGLGDDHSDLNGQVLRARGHDIPAAIRSPDHQQGTISHQDSQCRGRRSTHLLAATGTEPSLRGPGSSP